MKNSDMSAFYLDLFEFLNQGFKVIERSMYYGCMLVKSTFLFLKTDLIL